MLLRSTAVIALCLLFTSCAPSTPQVTTVPLSTAPEFLAKQEEQAAKKRAENEIAPGYTVQVNSPEDPQIGGDYQVEHDGLLLLPYQVRVNAAGLTEAGLRQRLEEAYSPYFRERPSLQVKVIKREYAVKVLGLVEKPGEFQVRQNASFDSLTALAGGLQKDGTGNPRARYVRIEQLGKTTLVKLSDYYSGAEKIDFPWQGGEVVFLQSDRGLNGDQVSPVERDYVQVLGQVMAPGEYPYVAHADFVYYLSKAQGPTARANMDNLVIFRYDEATKTSIHFALQNSVESLPEIRGGDVILVNSDVPTGTERALGNVGDGAGILNSIATMVLLFVSL